MLLLYKNKGNIEKVVLSLQMQSIFAQGDTPRNERESQHHGKYKGYLCEFHANGEKQTSTHFKVV